MRQTFLRGGRFYQEFFVWLYTIGGGGVPPAPPLDPPPSAEQSDQSRKKRNIPQGKSCRAILGTQTFGSQTLPSSLVIPGFWGTWRRARREGRKNCVLWFPPCPSTEARLTVVFLTASFRFPLVGTALSKYGTPSDRCFPDFQRRLRTGGGTPRPEHPPAPPHTPPPCAPHRTGPHRQRCGCQASTRGQPVR